MSTIPYKIIRSNRKTLALVIDSEANLIVRAPLHISDREIDDFIARKKRWILDKQQQVSAFGEKHTPVTVATGDSILYLGNTYTIIHEPVAEISITGTTMSIPEGYGMDEVICWLRNEASTIIQERVERYANIMGVSFLSVKMSEAKARWGSCSTKNNLNFAWRLIMCPVAVIDYVVVHELSHIEYKNHSAAFWARVKTVLPNYQEQQDWLKVNRKLMEIIG